MLKNILLYNTAHRQKEIFAPRDESCVTIYSCGPTVYSDPHIGNMRAYVFADVLRQTLQHIGGYTLKHITNITDVGHLTDDGDQGEDKMEKGARREGRTVWEVARTYEEHFLEYSDALAIQRFDAYTRATEYIGEQIAMVQQLINKGFTYLIAGDGIYMDTSKVEDYGKLAQLDIEGMRSHHRNEGAQIDSTKKRQLTDFALWKFSPAGEQRAMEWIFDGERAGTLLTPENRATLTEEEDITRGFPGWHIECSAMAVAHLGAQFDIHTGGVDHVPVHHTNEIAQAECALGVDTWVNYWLHCQFLQIDGSKVSKSKGDDLSIPGILEKGYDALDLRYFYMTGHYRSFLDFTREALDAAKKTRKNIIKKITSICEHIPEASSPGGVYTKLCEAVADDLDTVKSLTIIHTTLANISSISEQDIADILRFDDEVLKVGLRMGIEHMLVGTNIPDDIAVLRDEYIRVKEAKEYEKADHIRDELKNAGWMITLKEGTWLLSTIE